MKDLDLVRIIAKETYRKRKKENENLVKAKIELLNKLLIDNPETSEIHIQAKKKLIDLIDSL